MLLLANDSVSCTGNAVVLTTIEYNEQLCCKQSLWIFVLHMLLVPQDKIYTGNKKELKDYTFIPKLLNNL